MQNPSVPILPQANLAPVEPLFGLKDGKPTTPVYLADGLRELIKDLLARDKTTFSEIARTAHTVSNFIQGKQIWQPNYWTGQWTIQPANRIDPNRITAINIMQFYTTQQIKMITNSNPDIEPYDEYKQKEYKDKVKKAKAIWNLYESRFFTQWFAQQEALHGIITGWYGESVEYDNLEKGAKVFKEIFGEKQIQISPGYSKCFNCGQEGNYKDFAGDGNFIPNCPECGSTEILPPEAPVTQTYQTVEGLQPIQTGDLTLKLKSILNFRFNLKVRAEESSWSITRNVMPRRKLEWILGNIKLPAGDSRTDDGLKALDEISRAGNTLSGITTTTASLEKNEEIIVDKICVMPEDVAHIVNKKDTQTIDGGTIPEGTRASDLCPDGMTIYAINEGKIILAIFPGEHHKNELTTGVYHMRWESGHGRGSEDTVEVQKRFNRFDSQTVRFLESAATPAHTFIKGSVDRNHIKKIGTPSAVIPINQEVAQALNTTELIRQIQPGNVSGNLFQYTYDILNQFRQLTSHVTDFTNAFPGVDNRTATGAQLAKTSADSVYAPMLNLKAEVRVGTAENTLKGFNKHFQGVAVYASYGESSSGQHIGSYIKGEEIDCDVRFTVVRNSEQPKTLYDRQTDFVNMLASAGQAGGWDMIKQQDPKLAQALLEAFDIDIDDNVYDVTVDVCESRLEEALSLFKQFRQMQQTTQAAGQNMPDPPVETILSGLSQEITVEEPNHEIKAKWFSDYLDTPQGFGLSNDERSVVRMFVRTHYQMAVQQQQAISEGYAQATAAANPDQQHPMQKIAESINYKDAPDDIRRQMEQAAGMTPSSGQQPPPDQVAADQQLQRDAAMKNLDHQHKLEEKLIETGAKAATQDQQTHADLHKQMVDTGAKVATQQQEHKHKEKLAQLSSALKIKELKAAPKPVVAAKPKPSKPKKK